jgi:hypothetical protein
VLGEVRIFGTRVRSLRIGETLLIFPRIAHGIATAVFPEWAVGTVGKVLRALRYGGDVHGAREGGAG